MHVGIELASTPPTATSFAARQCAQAAEAVGYHAIWVVLRPLVPAAGPVALLIDAGAATERVRLGISAHQLPECGLPSLDRLPAERLSVGLAVEDALVHRLQRGWRPPFRLLLAARDDESLVEVARHADGWHAAGVPISDLATVRERLRRLAAGHDRDPGELAVVTRADITVTAMAAGPGRADYVGSIDQVVDDLLATRDAGVDEVVLSVGGDGPLDVVLETYAGLVERLELHMPA